MGREDGVRICEPAFDPCFHLSASFSPDGRRAAFACADGATYVSNVWGGVAPARDPISLAGGILAASLSPDIMSVVTVGADNTARVWRAWDGEPVGQPITTESPIDVASFSPDGKRILTASAGMRRRCGMPPRASRSARR